MLKSKYKLLIGITIGLFLTGITCVSAINLLADEILYNPTNDNWNVNNISSALDDLYTRANTPVHLTNYELTTNLPSGFSGTKVTPTVVVDGDTATIKCQTTVFKNGQGVVYLKIDNIENYKYLVVNVDGTSRQFVVGISDDVSSGFNITKRNSLLNYTDIEKPSRANLYVDVSDLSGTKYLILAGTHYDFTVSVTAYYY